MMEGSRWRRLRDVYERALDLTGDERSRFVERTCSGDPELMQDVERMLALEAEEGSFLEPPTASRPSPAEGSRVGSFLLGRPIATGGMGTVYEALQEDPRRKVALKIVREGFGGEAALRRFRFESQVLARLRHPGIAQVYEAGVHRSDAGEVPYFAMELVEGARDLLSSADARGLGLRARVALFVDVCDAVQHGHQHGVVHRDLKAANLLVDDEGHVKIIDFGIARALGDGPAGLTRAPVTRAGEIVGSLHTMSPEQFRGDPDAVDTRSDVYSLGMVLYELVCGRAAFDFDVPLPEIARRVSEDPPLAPRRARPDLPEDLGWILERALEKEPDRRYASASELAADLRRFLADEPVVAGPPSRTYRLRKFVRRHRSGVALTSIAVAALVTGATAALVGLLKARRAQRELALERNAAQEEAAKFRGINRVLEEMLTSVDPERDGREVRVADVLDRSSAELGPALAQRPEVEAPLRAVIGASYRGLGLDEAAQRELETAVELWTAAPEETGRERLEAVASLAEVLLARNELDGAERRIAEGRASARSALPPTDPIAADFALLHADLLLRRGRNGEAEHALRRTLDELGPEHPRFLAARSLLAQALAAQHRTEEALALARSVAETQERLGPGSREALLARLQHAELLMGRAQRWDAAAQELEPLLPGLLATLGEEHPDTLRALSLLVRAHTARGRMAEAYAVARELVPLLERVRGPDHPTTVGAREDLAVVLDGLGELAAGELVRRQAWETSRRIFGPDHERTLENELSVAVLIARQGRFEEALPHVERVLEVRRGRWGDDDVSTLAALDARSNIMAALGDLEGAERDIRAVVDGRTSSLGPEHAETLRARNHLVTLLARLGRFEEALEQCALLLESHRRVLDPASPVWVTLYGNAGNIAREHGDLDLAADYLAVAHERSRTNLPEDHPRRALAAWDLGVVRSMLGDAEQGLALLREALEVFQLRPTDEVLQHGRCHLDTSECLDALGRAEEAEAALREAVALLERAGEGGRPFLEKAREELRERTGD